MSDPFDDLREYFAQRFAADLGATARDITAAQSSLRQVALLYQEDQTLAATLNAISDLLGTAAHDISAVDAAVSGRPVSPVLQINAFHTEPSTRQ